MIRGGQIHDARIAALCNLHGVRALWKADRDFNRFHEINVRNPLIAQPCFILILKIWSSFFPGCGLYEPETGPGFFTVTCSPESAAVPALRSDS